MHIYHTHLYICTLRSLRKLFKASISRAVGVISVNDFCKTYNSTSTVKKRRNYKPTQVLYLLGVLRAFTICQVLRLQVDTVVLE